MFISFHFEKKYFVVIIFTFLFFIDSRIKVHEKLDLSLNRSSQIFLFILYFIEKYQSNIKNNIIISFRAKILLISIFIFEIIYVYLNFRFDLIKEGIDEFRKFFNILFFFLLNNLFLEKKFYCHHIIPIIMISITFPIVFYIFLNGYSKTRFILLIIISDYCYSFSILLIKYINKIYFISIYLVGTIIGIIDFIISCFTLTMEMKEIKEYNKIYLIVQFLYHLTTHYLFYIYIYRYEPVDALFNILFGYFIFDIIRKISKFSFEYIVLSLIYLNLIISSLIYLEILELHFCGLNKDLKKNIIIRGERETEFILTDGNLNIYNLI